MLSKRFPFGIYYELEDEVVYVYAILDLRRERSKSLGMSGKMDSLAGGLCMRRCAGDGCFGSHGPAL